jgi:LmbE family N-acetylglucosaminyl deacetylase
MTTPTNPHANHPTTVAADPRRLLGIWPHPDDEAYLSAGLMGRTIDAGGHVTVLTLTRGTKGTSDPADYDQPHFGVRRERELRASLAVVGVHDVCVGDFRDGECDLVPDETAIALLTDTIVQVAPDTIVTFGPDGITGHTDHCVVSAWVTEAWRRTGGAELLYATMTDEHVAQRAELHERIGLFVDRGSAGPASVPADRIALAADLSEVELDRKRRALAHHASQTEPLAALMGEATYRSWWPTEYFRRPTPAEIHSCAITFAPHDQRVTT